MLLFWYLPIHCATFSVFKIFTVFLFCLSILIPGYIPNDPGDIIGSYQLEEQIGKGSSSIVWKAVHTGTGKEAAVKIALESSTVTWIEKELGILKLIKGSGVPEIYESDTYKVVNDSSKAGAYIAMPLLGPDPIVAGGGNVIPIPTVAMMIHEALCILNRIHDLGVVHGDVKPENILMTNKDGTGDVWLVDFGLSVKYLDKVLCNSGTLKYLSLPNHRGCVTTRRDDIESLSYTALIMISGRLPWGDEESLRNIYKMKKDEHLLNCHFFENEVPLEFKQFVITARLEANRNDSPDYEKFKGFMLSIYKRLTGKDAFDWQYEWPKFKVI